MAIRKGLGIGSMYYGIGYGFSRADIGSAEIEMAEDGTTTVYSGACDMGQGVMTVVTQVAAEELGIEPEQIRVVAADTGSTPDAGPTSGSRATFVQGVAVQNAARELREEILDMASRMLECPRENLHVRRGEVCEVGTDRPMVSVGKVAHQLHFHGRRAAAWGWHDNTTQDVDPETSQGDAYATYGWATQLAEVEVDTETGRVRLTKLVSATDAGKAINPVAVEGQIEGGAAMGLGYGLYEQHILENGVPRTASLAFYLVPTAMDVPDIECEIVEVPDPRGPFGAKGVAEPATIPTTPAILNAIYDAIGIRITETPITPERVFFAIQEAKSRGEFSDD